MKTEMKELLGKEITKVEFLETLGAEYGNQWVDFCIANIEYKATAKVATVTKVTKVAKNSNNISRMNVTVKNGDYLTITEAILYVVKKSNVDLDAEDLLKRVKGYVNPNSLNTDQARAVVSMRAVELTNLGEISREKVANENYAYFA